MPRWSLGVSVSRHIVRVARAHCALAGGAPGAILMETLVAVMVFALVGTAVVSGLSTTQISGARTEGQSVAENIARNQMEYVFSLPYQDPPTTYQSVAVPQGYSVTAVAEFYVPGDANIEKIVVTVSRGGEQLLSVETLRAKA